jgi:hypothetical protein
MSKLSRLHIIILAVFVYLSFKPFTWFAIEGHWCWRLPIEGRTTQALVLEKKFTPGARDDETYYFKFQFETDHSVTVTGWTASNAQEYNSLKVGGRFPIVYLEGDPRWNRPQWVNDEKQFFYPWRPILSGFATLSLLFWLVSQVLRDLKRAIGWERSSENTNLVASLNLHRIQRSEPRPVSEGSSVTRSTRTPTVTRR